MEARTESGHAARRDGSDELATGLSLLAQGEHAGAAQYLARVAQQGNAIAQYQLGRLLRKGLGVLRDTPQAAGWLRRAAEQGHAKAQCALAQMLAHGEGVQQDLTAAAAWYGRAAERGNHQAQFHLAALYRDGQGVPRDLQRSAAWLREAAAAGVAAAQFGLGELCEAEGGKTAAAGLWYGRAAEQGYRPAQDALARLVTAGDIETPPQAEGAIAWWAQRAVDYGCLAGRGRAAAG